MGCYILDTRNILVKDRVVPPTQGAQQHTKLCEGKFFNVEIQIEVRNEPILDVEYFIMRHCLLSEKYMLYIVLPNWPPKIEGLQAVTCQRLKENSHEIDSISTTFMQTEAFCLLNSLVGCYHLRIMRHLLENERVPDMGGPYNSGAILLAALARGPMATRLVLEYGASRFLKNNQRVSLQALIHYSCLGDPKTNRTAHMLWQEGVLQSDDLPELEKTLTTYKIMDRTLRERDVQTMERVGAMVEAVKTPPSLQQLAKNALSKALGPMPGRRQKVRHLNIEGYVKHQLLFADAIDTRKEHFSIVHDCSYQSENGCVDYDLFLDLTRQRHHVLRKK